MKAKFKGLSEYGYRMLKDEAEFTDDEITALRLHEDEYCELSVAVDNGGFHDNYWDAKFEDGYEVFGLSGLHFVRR